MDIGSIFLILGLLLLVGLFVARPLLEPQSKYSTASGNAGALADSHAEHDYSHLLAERDRLISALQELDFDYALGKIPEADYPGQRAALLKRGADLLRQIDAVEAGAAGEGGSDVEKRLEAAIAARRADMAGAGRRSSPVSISPDDALEAELANRRRQRSEKAAGFCPKCGAVVHKSDRFCPKCGASL